MRNTEALQRRNAAIRKRCEELQASKTAKGRSIMSYAVVIETLSREFFLTEGYIMRLLKQ